MTSRISIPNLLTPDLAMQTVPAEVDVRSGNPSRPQTPPQKDMSLSTNGIYHQQDVESCSEAAMRTTEVHSLLPPAKLTSSGNPTWKDVFSVHMLQPSTITSASMALQQQMFDGYGSLGLPGYSLQMVPPCCCDSSINFLLLTSLCDQQLLDSPSLGNYEPAFLHPTYNSYYGWHPGYASGMCKPLENGASNGYFMESPYPEAYLTGASLSSAVFVDDTTVELFQPWTYGLDAQPVQQQDFVLGNGDSWNVIGGQNGSITDSAPSFSGRITSLDS
ncbi:hypothetical protein CDEST_02144 [Colletotrichum destructivum]|uniref:Uncharacterized protein n=1 Tax=Colletotrichum destructivum TaxID=34406 RepID=A0AAX4I2F6_9PEZI|nr:hypothetical protein CDEST_02144 [Colletotrichum destructivum]